MKRRIYKKWLKNPLNKRLIWKFCKPFPKIPPVAFVEKHDPAWVFEQLSKHTDMLIQREMDRLCIPKELLRPINIGASGNIIASLAPPFKNVKMKKDLSFERIVSVAAHGTEKEAERLTYDILLNNVAEILEPAPYDITAILKLEDERFAKHLGITYDELQELKRKLYEQQG